MIELYNYIEERINFNNNHSIDIEILNNEREILFEIQSSYYYELRIILENENINIYKFDFSENKDNISIYDEEYLIFSINSILFEYNYRILYEIIYNFIFNLINYIK